MLIKKNRAEQLKPAGASVSAPASSRPTHEPGWSYEAMIEGRAVDRRKADTLTDRRLDRRRDYRRVEDKELISRAHQEANAIRENAYREGFESGLEQGRHTIEALQVTLHKLMAAREEALLSVAEDIAPMAIDVAEQILRTEVSCDPELVVGLVKDTLDKAKEAGNLHAKSILIRVHPEDVATVKAAIQEHPHTFDVQAELIVMEDATVDRGSCTVETGNGLIDASFSTQVALLRKLFGTPQPRGPS